MYLPCGTITVYGQQYGPYLDRPLSVRFTVKISPKNGAPSSIIVKTFVITPEFRNWRYW